ncbi:nitroreductase family deazaflavin-dependent oxidoreductase [Catellatospora sp. KI3]|uniref:nitroreductase family deazaflavin-dependent oxidoreductase n=1 Tax=Catellatospora sp. KI3 TaxID=3041620 RepID=UPI0024828DE2|nr:nitroreductase family deazaflavin-dependent oxidoreductase [Catellatospora sp. KI3]MDI1464022.1 nitroreductase family deazaflavin-dependent oxidoreductase [Catellatospora sp. KI3]
MDLTGEYVPGTWASSAKQVAAYEASDGAKGNKLMGKPVVIVTMRGARSGKIRKTPLMRVEHDGSYALVASVGGAPNNPDWYHNIATNQTVMLQDGPVRKEYKARLVSGAERDQWWRRAVEAFPTYESFRKKTGREIPVFVLDPS